jgi:hypothetical protein
MSEPIDFLWSLRKIRKMSVASGLFSGLAILGGAGFNAAAQALIEGVFNPRTLFAIPIALGGGLLGFACIEAMLRLARRWTGMQVLPDGLLVRESAWRETRVPWADMERGDIGAVTEWSYLYLTVKGLRRRVNVNLELDDFALFHAMVEAHAPSGHWLVPMLGEHFRAHRSR